MHRKLQILFKISSSDGGSYWPPKFRSNKDRMFKQGQTLCYAIFMYCFKSKLVYILQIRDTDIIYFNLAWKLFIKIIKINKFSYKLIFFSILRCKKINCVLYKKFLNVALNAKHIALIVSTVNLMSSTRTCF